MIEGRAIKAAPDTPQEPMLVPIDDARLGQAMDLLVRGFPRKPRRTWEVGIEQLRAHNPTAAKSLGHLLIAKQRPAGVLLSIRGESVAPDGARFNVTNLSSWYVEPEHRMLAPIMLHSILRTPATVFTDLTPSPRVIPMLPAFGFKPLNRGLSAIALPVVAAKAAPKTRVCDLASLPRDALEPRKHELLRRHAELGAIAGVLNVGNTWHPLLFLKRSLRCLPTAQLIYCESNAVLLENLAAVARFLLKQGRLMLIIDIPLEGEVPGRYFLNRGMKFATARNATGSAGAGVACFEGRTDYAGSELLFFKM
jgi:hypothetical protein